MFLATVYSSQKVSNLVAAFDHRNIFIDPDPDPRISYEERRRLFDLPRSSWEDYNQDLLSPGGGIFPRSAKTISLSAEARQALDVGTDSISGVELVQAVLRMRVGLLWNGGIGTYIKADRESHLDVGDPANDAVRVNASEVRAQVIGEGGNLGITAWGRVALASRGVRLNSDAIDNSAGVDLSDHEVNLKILFSQLSVSGEMNHADRNACLERVRREVCEKTLRNNWTQSRMISLDVIRSQRSLAAFQRAIAFLAGAVPFDRRALFLPGERLLQQRQGGLYRPELGVLCANAKTYLRSCLDANPMQPHEILPALLSYFPNEVVTAFRSQIERHPLALQIANAMLSNQIIDDAGATWIAETVLRTGSSVPNIVRAYQQVSTWIDATALKGQIDTLERSLRTTDYYDLRLMVEDTIAGLCTWSLKRSQVLGEHFVALFRDAFDEVTKHGESADEPRHPNAAATPILVTHRPGVGTNACSAFPKRRGCRHRTSFLAL